jgi:hypothetical protein
MGYDLHITRADDWAENEGREITREEWLALVAGDEELTLDPVNGDEYALWSGPSEHAGPWLCWCEGNLSAKNPDPALIGKMVEIAGRLGARVQGDDGEFYPEALREAEARRSLPWWRRLLGG